MYQIALRKAREAEDTSNLSSDDNSSKQRRKTIANSLYTDFALGESSITPDPPILDMELAHFLTGSNNILNLDSTPEQAYTINNHNSRLSSTITVNTNKYLTPNLIANDNNVNENTVDNNGNGVITNKTPALNEECPTCTKLLKEVQELKVLVQANQKSITDRVDYMSTKMEEMFTLISLNYDATSEDGDAKFPLTSLDDMEDFENELKNLEFKQKMLRHLKRVGGTSAEDNTRRLWKYLLSVELQYKCNWTSLKDKKALSGTLLNVLIENVVQQSFGTATIKTIQSTTKDYIQCASNRLPKKRAE